MTIKVILNLVVIMVLALHMGDLVAGNKARRTRRLGTNGNQNATNKFKKGEIIWVALTRNGRTFWIHFSLHFVLRQRFGSRTLAISFKSIHRHRAFKMFTWNVVRIQCLWNWKRIPILRASCIREAISTIKPNRALSNRNTQEAHECYRCDFHSINVTQNKTVNCSQIQLSSNTIQSWSHRAMLRFRCCAISENHAV